MKAVYMKDAMGEAVRKADALLLNGAIAPEPGDSLLIEVQPVALLDMDLLETPMLSAGCNAICPNCSQGTCASHTDTTPNYHTCSHCGKHWVI